MQRLRDELEQLRTEGLLEEQAGKHERWERYRWLRELAIGLIASVLVSTVLGLF